jgi:hypothetical protein
MMQKFIKKKNLNNVNLLQFVVQQLRVFSLKGVVMNYELCFVILYHFSMFIVIT